ncbi:MAG: hypothetical protein TR69_WS6001000804 [candidate division WS6 bacterium OLB20]|uniref:Uncharacterized protein n=1 Tax=candidate division WS6 bacterium OLB20 TaxID=1617426 RepID=A0A136LYR2_9BACT|nr:MAG: hypothetical protein TR69_WS6001000804 [candidate division WS6 bacterium OLB20]
MTVQRFATLIKRAYPVLLVLIVVVLPLFISAEPASAQVSEPCSLESSEPCEPPTIRELQYLVTRVIYAAWAFGGIVFMVLLVVIGGIYLTSAGDQSKVEIAKKRAGQWVIGLLLYFLAYPISATLMQGLIAEDASCYENLRDPGFTFFFPQVCTGGSYVGQVLACNENDRFVCTNNCSNPGASDDIEEYQVCPATRPDPGQPQCYTIRCDCRTSACVEKVVNTVAE